MDCNQRKLNNPPHEIPKTQEKASTIDHQAKTIMKEFWIIYHEFLLESIMSLSPDIA